MAQILRQYEREFEVVVAGDIVYCCTIKAFEMLKQAGLQPRQDVDWAFDNPLYS